MSTDKVELNLDNNNNTSLEEEAKQQEQAPVDTEVKVSQPDDNTTNSTEEVRPEWLPEKFKTAEDLAKAYSELEKKQSAPEEVQTTEPDNVQEPVTENPMNKFYSEFSEKGELSEKSYEELNQMGLSKDLVDGYIAGQEAIANSEVRMIHETVGGEDNYKKIIDFAKTNLSDAEQNAFNETLDNGSIEQVKFAVQAIASRAGVSAEAPQQMINGDSVETSSDVFESVAQITEAMNNPKYAQDPAYRKKVEDKIARSTAI